MDCSWDLKRQDPRVVVTNNSGRKRTYPTEFGESQNKLICFSIASQELLTKALKVGLIEFYDHSYRAAYKDLCELLKQEADDSIKEKIRAFQEEISNARWLDRELTDFLARSDEDIKVFFNDNLQLVLDFYGKKKRELNSFFEDQGCTMPLSLQEQIAFCARKIQNIRWI